MLYVMYPMSCCSQHWHFLDFHKGWWLITYRLFRNRLMNDWTPARHSPQVETRLLWKRMMLNTQHMSMAEKVQEIVHMLLMLNVFTALTQCPDALNASSWSVVNSFSCWAGVSVWWLGTQQGPLSLVYFPFHGCCVSAHDFTSCLRSANRAGYPSSLSLDG